MLNPKDKKQMEEVVRITNKAKEQGTKSLSQEELAILLEVAYRLGF